MNLKSITLAMCLMVPILSFAQSENSLRNDLKVVARNLSDEQLARLIDYANKLQNEPTERKRKINQKPKAIVVWNNSKYELSNITKGDILFLPFKHTNFSDTPYIIKDIKSNCDCVTVQKPTKPLLKNQSSTLMLSVDTSKITDSNKGVTIMIYDNSSPNGKTYLFVNADILEPPTAQH